MDRAANEWKEQRVLLLAVIGIGIVIRLVLIYATRETGLMIEDEQHYHTLALNILHGHGFAWEPGHLTSMRPPLYPAFMAAVWAATDTDSVLTVRAAQIVIALATVYVAYRLGFLLFDGRVGLLAATGLCLYPSLLGFNIFVLTETLFTFLLTLMVLGVVVLLRTSSMWVALGTGAVLGLAALTRSVLWLFPVVLCTFVFLGATGSRRQRFTLAVLVLIGYAAFVAPWTLRNTYLQGVPTTIDTMGGITLRMGNYEHTLIRRAWDPVTLHGDNSIFEELGKEHPDAGSWTEGQKDKWALKKAAKYMWDHPGLTIQRAIVKLGNFWGLERTIIAGWQRGAYSLPKWLTALGTVIISLAYVGAMILASLGVGLAPPQERRAHAFLLLVVGFILAMHMLAFGHERYHLPLIPIVLLYAASAVGMRSWRRLREGLKTSAGPAVAIMVLLGFWSLEVFIIEAERIHMLLCKLTD